ncbi:MAG: acyl-CoA dehydratase activase [Clostridiales Family XIII bacterium]|jgi:predicted CoA-substrate-specific enzyme activase|nr:acyl-CoA dehydratase activase [Clostridiales Family XIII bacterium]
MTEEYRTWPEGAWQSEQFDGARPGIVTAGVDIGTTSAQAAILAEGSLIGWANIRTGANFKKAADDVIEKAIGSSGLTLDRIDSIAATGFGDRNAAYASTRIDEVRAHAYGARFMFGPSVRTVVDLGGQTVKAIRLHEWTGVRDFMMNDKCATGFGRSVEEIADLLRVPVADLGEKSLRPETDPEPVSTTCYAFANPETIGLFRTGFREETSSEDEIIAAHLFAIAWRVLGVIGKLASLEIGDVSVEEGLAFTGGLAKNRGVTRRIERELKVSALESDCDPQIAGAIGAALLAGETDAGRSERCS